MSIGANRMRITGLSSGLDTESIVTQLMQLEKNKVSSVYRNKTTAEWKLEAYSKINTDLTNFTNKYMSVLSEDNIMSANAYNSYKAHYAENSAFSVKATANLIPGNYKVTKTEMADYAKIQGNNVVLDKSAKLSDVAGLQEGDKLSFTINDEYFEFTGDQTVTDMMDAVNASDAGVKMYYSEINSSFSFVSTALGSEAKIELKDMSSNAVSLLGMNAAEATGKDALIEINGKTITKSTNNFELDGMVFEITGNYQAAAGEEGHAITFTQDHDAVVDKVKGFIEEYNKIIDELYGKVREEKDRDFYPLTEDEKAEMEEDEITKWTDKAKSGILRSDSVVQGLLSELRAAAYSIVGDTGMMAADIGITTSGKEGKLKLDEEAFKKALADNPDKVAEIMTGRSTATDKTQEYSESGFVARLNITMTNYRQSIRADQMQQQTQRIYEYETKILDLEEKLVWKEEALWAQYSALETLMTNMNSQSDWLASQLAAL